MTPEIATVEAPVESAPVETPQEIETSSSLAEHVASFDPQDSKRPDEVGSTPPRAEAAEKPTRHRAQSQKAGPKDVEQINALTRELRQIEEEIGIKRQAGESERAFGLRRQLETAKALRDARKGSPAPTPQAQTPPTRPAVPPQHAPDTFSEPKPTLAQFAGEEDPYEAKVLATMAWQMRKDAFDQKNQQTAAQTQEQIQQADTAFVEWAKKTTDTHDQRLQAFVAANPKAKEIFDGVIARNDVDLSPVTLVAIHTSEHGPEMMLALAQHPDLADDLLRESLNQSAFDAQHRQNPLVALQQRRLLRALQTPQAGTTGSAAVSRPVTVAPRPLNPVRTAPQTPSETAIRDGSLVDHARSHPYGASPKFRR